MAIEKGHVDALFRIAQLYQYGDGVKKDKVLAKEWQAKYDAA